jgi:cyclic nucleotide gated channel
MMDEQVLDAICEKLIPCLYDQGACVDHRMADPINEMFFIVRSLLDSVHDGGHLDFLNVESKPIFGFLKK